MAAQAHVPPERTLALTGDVMLGRLVGEAIARDPAHDVWGDMRPAMLRADARLINLECVISDRGRKWRPFHKAFHFRAPPAAVDVLRAARIDFASQANNHVLDYGTEAMLDGLERLRAAGIAYAGAGRTLAEAAGEAWVDAGGLRVAVLACTDNTPEWRATAARPGVFYVDPGRGTGESRLMERIAQVRAGADVVVLSIHWGPNMRTEPPATFRAFARRVTAAGVDVLHGHSAHVVQGIEFINRAAVLYDTGDFVDDYAVDPHLRNDWSFLFLVHLRGRTVCGVTLLPALIDRLGVRRVRGDPAPMMARMRQRCRELGTPAAVRGDRLEVAPPG